MDRNEVIVECRYKENVYKSKYLGDVCCAETFRNCCVNLCIDPDMLEGRMLNVKVYKRTINESGVELYTLWDYLPYERISACSTLELDDSLYLRIMLST